MEGEGAISPDTAKKATPYSLDCTRIVDSTGDRCTWEGATRFRLGGGLLSWKTRRDARSLPPQPTSPSTVRLRQNDFKPAAAPAVRCL